MSKATGSLELPLKPRAAGQTLGDWLYAELRTAIRDGRLKPGTRLPASRDFAAQYGVSRGTVVAVFERLHADGDLVCHVGSGSWVSDRLPAPAARQSQDRPPQYVRRIADRHRRPKAFHGLRPPTGLRPFQMREAFTAEFPIALWSRLAARRAKGAGTWLRTDDDGRGYRPLRESLSQYLGASRGIACTPEQIFLVTGVQQALDHLARFLLRPGDPLWIEDPGYFGATIAFEEAGVQLMPVPLDAEGLSVAAGRDRCPNARGAFVTPGHQFPLGMTMSPNRRAELLAWAARTGAFIIEDDYDSEYRFEGHPAPALQSLDRNGSVIVAGTFNKLLFPGLRIGYIVMPPALVDYYRAWRVRTDFRSATLEQAVLCDFIAGGHLGRHLRRMRSLYGNRLDALLHDGRRYLGGLLEISTVQAGLYTAGLLRNGMTSAEAERAAWDHDVEVLALDRYTLDAPDPKGVVLGFAAFREPAIRDALRKLARAWSAFC